MLGINPIHISTQPITKLDTTKQ